MNPELRATLNTISRNLESANETAQENIYTFSHNYIDPCVGSVRLAFEGCSQTCFPARDERWERRRRRQRGEDVSFGFYDDWDDDGDDELGALLAGGGGGAGGGRQGGGAKGGYRHGQRTMDYGTRSLKKNAHNRHDEAGDPTVIPSSSYLGFLERLPWRLGAKGIKYRPSAADLQEHMDGEWRRGQFQETEPLMEDTSEESGEDQRRGKRTRTHTRQRSGTANSRSTTNSLSSRGDLIPSDDELEADAVPLDDEFAMVLERRTTGATTSDDYSSGKTGSDNKKARRSARASTRTVSSKSLKSLPKSIMSASSGRKSSQEAQPRTEAVQDTTDTAEPPTLADLKIVEDRLRDEEEQRIEKNREAARKLATERGLDSPRQETSETSAQEPKDTEIVQEIEVPNPDRLDSERGHNGRSHSSEQALPPSASEHPLQPPATPPPPDSQLHLDSQEQLKPQAQTPPPSSPPIRTSTT